MHLPLFKQWKILAFPDTSLFSTGEDNFFSIVVLLFLAASVVYLTISYLIARFLPARRQKVTIWLSTLYTIGIMLMSFEISSWANATSFQPLLLACALALLNIGFIVSLCGSWFTNNRETTTQLSLFESVRAHYWFTLLSTSLIIFVIFVQVPIISPQNRTVYWGPILLSSFLYFLLVWLLTNHSCFLFGLDLKVNTLSDKLKARCEALDLFIWQQGDYQLILLKKGFRNAVALFPQQKIFIGIDLLEHLSEEETRAIALHEIGHLQDKKYVPLRHRISQILPFLIVAFIIADQGNLFPSFLFQTAVFFAGLILFSQLFKRLRLKGEFVADTYVKDFPGDFHSHLISGIKKITRLNGLDKDFCKTHNYAHLDVDEREQMVKDGNFSLQRKPIRKFFFILIPAMVFGVLFQFGWSAIFPSKSKQWQTLHKLYHAQTSRYEFALAAETIHKCFDFSLKNYGEIDRRTYISLKHLATTSIREKDFSTAEQYIIRAGHIGEELYGSESLRRNGERKLLARILIKESRKEEAKQVYTTILSLQQKLKDTPWKISRTLYALAELSDVQQKIDYYQEIILLYKNSEPGADNSPSEYIFSDLAEAYIQSGQPQKATSLLAEAVPVIRDKKGTNSEEYGNILWEFANLLSDQKHFKKAETAYQQCLTATSEMEPYISIGCRYDAGENFRRQGLLAQAQQQTLLALNREEELYGRDSEEILFGLNKLAQLAEQSGNAAEAQALQRRASTINEKTK